MASRVKISSVTVRDLSTKNKQEIALENCKNDKVRQLTALRIYHQNKIREIDSDLETMLKEDVSNIDY